VLNLSDALFPKPPIQGISGYTQDAVDLSGPVIRLVAYSDWHNMSTSRYLGIPKLKIYELSHIFVSEAGQNLTETSQKAQDG
jgi:hypothetical protein